MEQGNDKKPAKDLFQRSPAFERRKAKRQQITRLEAYYWDGGAPRAHEVRDISTSGFYVLSDQSWYIGTMVDMTLQIKGIGETEPERSIAMRTKVVRMGSDGAGFIFAMGEGQKWRRMWTGERKPADKNSPEDMLRRFLAQDKD